MNTLAERIVVDPVTRIEGHLRIEAEVENGVIKNAYSSGTCVRGLEVIVQDRDPRDVWAFVQRICGVCTTTHALASLRSVEYALDIKIPRNAHLIRDIMHAVLWIHDHVVHFYHLHALDWVDVVASLKADPAETSKIAQSISDWPNSSPGYFATVKQKVQTLVESGQLGIFANGYWGHPAYKLPAEVNLLAVAHYLEALEWQKEIVQIHTIFGGKNPHPHYVVGGMATPLDNNSDNAVHIERLMHVSRLIDEATDFVNKVYIPDVIAIAGFYKDATYGGGLNNYMSYGDFSKGDIRDVDQYRVPRGAIINGNLSDIQDVDPTDLSHVQEFIDKSWYKYDGVEEGVGKHPWEGSTEFNYTGPKEAYTHLDVEKKYSWLKTPRFKNEPMEVGPLARVMIAYAKGDTDVKQLVDDVLKKLDLPITALHSALGRTAARALEAVLAAKWMREDFDELLSNIKNGNKVTFDRSKWEPSSWPNKAQGVGWVEAPRGALGHWIVIEDGKTANYQAVVPTTWNASPRDNQGVIGAYEASLAGTPMVNEEQPLELLRVVHSFDPCLACAVHLTDLESQKQIEVRLG